MGLQNLPPEILQQIARLYVNNVSVAEAWRMRETCKSVRLCIEYEVLARQPLGAFLHATPIRINRKILEWNIDKYLFHRVDSLYGAYPFIPNFIRTMVDILVQAAGRDTQEVRLRYTESLCKTFADTYKDAFDCITTDMTVSIARGKVSTSLFDTDNVHTRVAAAAAVGSCRAIGIFVAGAYEMLWRDYNLSEWDSLPFGSPLNAATFCGRLTVVKAIIKRSEVHKGDMSDKFFPDVCEQVLINSIEWQQEHIAKFLLEHYNKTFGRPSAEALTRWSNVAIEAGNENLVSIIFNAGTSRLCRLIIVVASPTFCLFVRLFGQHSIGSLDRIFFAFIRPPRQNRSSASSPVESW
ncbi:hypothetical protein P153DRAFT_359982 [Dothidotthia symphoricarpi CBS 119687]|uniref:Uncharacterized protein n=1 Tax=Dothidotthia symphoricarpi CBS 119687 TaxID=1392245 RepID=A0A6A6A3E7_9PLEO|nr:uncharacterized protein P153DRAFT_359982 [Dothidotthia symphoricarpi CBS 119687]KAF2125634.1 hypothetical protein P153DRAFT_359982 [Dothidotthia symphoricarpi CBS 119687]